MDLSLLLAEAKSSTSWCFEEAEKLMMRLDKLEKPKELVIFETGYGPSGLPHIGTFGEVARTLMVCHCYDLINKTNSRSKLICFSDDMDGLRKVPGNVPCQQELQAYLGKPLSAVPDPFSLKELLEKGVDAKKLPAEIEKLPSFGDCNNARLRAFLDRFGFKYEFASATEHYKSGKFDRVLYKMLENYDEIMKIMLPSLGTERQATYSIFLPISPTTGQVLQVPILGRDEKRGTILYKDPDSGKEVEQSIYGGQVKCQWKADWALRWVALGVDYEMAGKDLIDSVALSGKICQQLGALPPGGFNYELFLDEKGQKISKSKGNGLTIDEWLKYAPDGSLRLYMYQKPKSAKRLSFDIIPKLVDDYYKHLEIYRRALINPKKINMAAYIGSPLFFIYDGKKLTEDIPPISYSLLLNLVTAAGGNISEEILWKYVLRCVGPAAKENKSLTALITHAVNYYRDYVAPTIKLAIPTKFEVTVLRKVYWLLSAMQLKAIPDGDIIQNKLLDVARNYETYQDKRKKNKAGKYAVNGEFFQMLYRTLLGQENGPRFGSFIRIYGLPETKGLIGHAIWRATLARTEAAENWAQQQKDLPAPYKELWEETKDFVYDEDMQLAAKHGILIPEVQKMEEMLDELEEMQQNGGNSAPLAS